MMKWHRVEARAGFEVVVNGRIEDKTLLHVTREDQVFFVSFAPWVTDWQPIQAPCREGVTHEIQVTVRAQLQRGSLQEILRGAGYSTHRNPLTLTVEEFAKRQGVWAESRAAIQTYVQGASFFDLGDKDATKRELHERIESRCTRLGIVAEVVSCNVNPLVPESALLASLAAMGQTDPRIASIVRYFHEVIRQHEFLNADQEEAKVQAQQQIIKARTDLKVFEIQETQRIVESEQLAKEKAEQRQMADLERNARIKANNASLEFAYKDGRIDEEKALALKELDLIKVKMASEDARREAKQRDNWLELEREESQSRIRREELAHVLDRLKEFPAPNYSGLQTLVASGGSLASDASGLASGLVLGLLGRFPNSSSQQRLPLDPRTIADSH